MRTRWASDELEILRTHTGVSCKRVAGFASWSDTRCSKRSKMKYAYVGPRIKQKEYAEFSEAIALARSLAVKTVVEYQKRYKEHERLPADPSSFYKDKGWTCWGDFLGTGRGFSG